MLKTVSSLATVQQQIANITNPYVVQINMLGSPLSSNQTVYVLFEHAVTFPANFAAIATGQTSGATGTANATSTVICPISKRTASPATFGTSVGNVTVGSGGVVATLNTAGGTPITTAVGDLWAISGPSVPDATFSNLIVTLVGTR